MDTLSIVLAVIAVIVTCVLLVVLYASRNYRMFANQGIAYIKPLPAMGSMLEIAKLGFITFHEKYYKKYNGEKVYGYFENSQPVLVVKDLDMLQDIMVKNFNCFVDRRTGTKEEPLGNALVNLEGDHWRHVRNAVSPTFTTGKLKKKCPHVEMNAKALRDNLQASAGTSQELKDTMSYFAMDAIASAGFGVSVDSLNDPTSPFSVEAKKMLNFSKIKLALIILFPWVYIMLSKIGLTLFPKSSVKFFTSFVDAALEKRVQVEENSKGRSDFIQLVVDEGRKQESGRKALTHKEFHGQAFVFIFAGYETVSTTLSFSVFILAHHPDVIRKLQQEIDDVLHGDFPTYEAVQSMTYLDMCLHEAMRLYPAAFIVDRKCTQDCVVRGISVKKETLVLFPLMQIYRDPNYFPEPLNFDPERHSADSKENRHPFAFLPFGQGPRNCIGMRFALLELKLAVAAVLQVLTPEPCEKSVYPPKLNKFQLKAEDGLWVKFVRRDKNKSCG